jgi:hypothetical protein
MGESNDERLARKKRERAEFLKQKAQDDALEEAISKDPQLRDYLDWDFDRQIKQLTGISMSEMSKQKPGEGVSQKDIDEAMEVIKRAKKKAEGGWLSSGDPEAAQKMLDSSSAVQKIGKRNKSCFLAALVLLASGSVSVGGIIWAAAEVLSRVLS